VIQKMQQAGRNGLERPTEDAEARQQHLKDALRISRYDEEGNQKLTRRAKCHHRAREEQERSRTGDANHQDQEQDDKSFDEPEQRAQREEEKKRFLQVVLEVGRPSAAFGEQTKRYTHQGVEGRLNGAEINGTTREQKEGQRNHEERAINPDGNRALRRNRASARAMRPSSLS
jgi:hypothetical protein